MRRSTLSVCAGIVAVSAIVAGFWTSHGHRSHAGRESQPLTVSQLASQQRSTPDGQPIRTVYPGPLGGSAQPISPPPQSGAVAESAPPAAAPAVASSAAPQTAQIAPPELTPPQEQGDSTLTTGVTTETAAVPSNPPAPSGPGTDLNTASVEELNALGAGMIGRRIIAFRPYASPEDLVTKRVLKRADYEIIKAAVVVR
nr:helix-hairpin-helix domain-containing protein [Methylobacterium nodulans]